MALEIIGAGFGRTGTNSLKIALEHLGYGPCHHMFEVRDNPELLADWVDAADGRQMDWENVFRDYRSQVDWPGAGYWRELVAAFPEARVILSVREPNGWFDSVQATIHQFVQARGKHDSAHLNAIADMVYRSIVQSTFDDRLSDRDHAIGVFERHNEEVKSSVAAERLLVFDVRQGWEPLCSFLGTEIPDVDFPRTNSSRDYRKDVLTEN